MMDEVRVAKHGYARAFYVIIGTLSLTLGIVGIALPILPTTPFLLLSAACYARGSERFHCWLLQNRILGRYIREYKEGRMSMISKTFTLAILWATMSVSALLLVEPLWIKALLLLVAISVSLHILTIGTSRVSGQD
jgi:uncharacterized membrane protein YbaN (DUF454 family)